jgi:hypothetical protein
VYIRVFFTSAVAGREWSVSRHSRFIPGPLVPIEEEAEWVPGGFPLRFLLQLAGFTTSLLSLN